MSFTLKDKSRYKRYAIIVVSIAGTLGLAGVAGGIIMLTFGMVSQAIVLGAYSLVFFANGAIFLWQSRWLKVIKAEKTGKRIALGQEPEVLANLRHKALADFTL